MRSTTSVSTSGGSSRWITVDSMQNAFGIGMGVTFSMNNTATATVYHTFDPTDGPTHQVSVSCSGSTTVTVTDVNHGLISGDSVTITGATNSVINGTYDITALTDNTYSYTIASSQTYSGIVNCLSLRVFPHSTLVDIAGVRADGNYAFPIYACKVKMISGEGTVTLTVVQGLGL